AAGVRADGRDDAGPATGLGARRDDQPVARLRLLVARLDHHVVVERLEHHDRLSRLFEHVARVARSADAEGLHRDTRAAAGAREGSMAEVGGQLGVESPAGDPAELRARGPAQRDPPEALDLLAIGRIEVLREQPVQQPHPMMREQDTEPEVEVLDLVDALAEPAAAGECAAADHHGARLADPVLLEPAAHELREEFPALVDAGEAREALVRSRVLLAPAWVDASVDLDLARGEDEP